LRVIVVTRGGLDGRLTLLSEDRIITETLAFGFFAVVASWMGFITLRPEDVVSWLQYRE